MVWPAVSPRSFRRQRSVRNGRRGSTCVEALTLCAPSADLADKAGAYTEDAAIAGLAAGALVAVAWATGLIGRPASEAPPPPAEGTDKERVERLKDRV